MVDEVRVCDIWHATFVRIVALAIPLPSQDWIASSSSGIFAEGLPFYSIMGLAVFGRFLGDVPVKRICGE